MTKLEDLELEKLIEPKLRKLKDFSYDELNKLLKKLYERNGKNEQEELWTLDEEIIKTEQIRNLQKESGYIDCFNNLAQKQTCQELDCYWRGMCIKDVFGIKSVLKKISEFNSKDFLIEDLNVFLLNNEDYRNFQKYLNKEQPGTVIKKIIMNIIDEFEKPISIDTLLILLNHSIKIPQSVVDHLTFYEWYKKLGKLKKRKIINALGLNYTEYFEKYPEKILPFLKTKIEFNKKRDTKMRNNINKNTNATFQIPANIILFQGLDCTELDNYFIQFNDDDDYDEEFVLIKNESDISILGVLKKVNEETIENKGLQPNSYYLTIDKDQIPTRKKIKNDYNFIIDIHGAIRSVNIRVEEPEYTESVLCIDFGTSNTTAGAYFNKSENERLNELRKDGYNYVRFKSKNEWKYVLPTILLANDSDSEDDDQRFLIGYDAENEIIKNDYNPNGTILRGIKKYLGNINEYVTIFDKDKRTEELPKHKIVRSFLDYIIQTAENQFKCKFKNLHFSTPIAHKNEYLNSLKEILPEYNVKLGNESLDEGIAVLYDIILEENNTDRNSTSKKVLVIDCGGGTTDLASCSFSKEEITENTDNIIINIEREECEADFGGNKITDRILQYMQIVLANTVNEYIDTEIANLIPNEAEVLAMIEDGEGLDKIYSELEEVCRKAEEIIPIDFEKYKSNYDDYKMIKKNYYLLWSLAEQIKIAFFSSNEVSSANLSLQISNNSIQLNRLISKSPIKLEQYDFKVTPFTIRDIEALIYADIYYVLNKLLRDFSQEELLSYDYLRLSGQSSRIGLFRNALKEFIPGKKIKFNNFGKKEDLFEKLKLNCLRGAISYNNEFMSGFVEVSICYNSSPKLKTPIYIHGKRGMQLLFNEGTNHVDCAGYMDFGRNAALIEFKIGDNEKSYNLKDNKIYTYKKLGKLEEKLNYKNFNKFDLNQLNINVSRAIFFIDDRKLKIGIIKRTDREYILSEIKSYELSN
jgi:hypothetical protein